MKTTHTSGQLGNSPKIHAVLWDKFVIVELSSNLRCEDTEEFLKENFYTSLTNEEAEKLVHAFPGKELIVLDCICPSASVSSNISLFDGRIYMKGQSSYDRGTKCLVKKVSK